MRKEITIEFLKGHIEELKKKFPQDEPICYANISMSQLSIARYSGMCKVNGLLFVYNPTDDSLIRDDVLRWLGTKARKTKKKDGQGTLPLAEGT